MADEPPPYSWSNPQHASEEDRNTDPFADRYLGHTKVVFSNHDERLRVSLSYDHSYAHRHDAYATMVTVQGDPDRLINTVHFSEPKLPSPSLSRIYTPISKDFKAEVFGMVQGFQDLGTFEIQTRRTQEGTHRNGDIRRLVRDELARRLPMLQAQDRLLNEATATELSRSEPQHGHKGDSTGSMSLIDSGKIESLVVQVYKMHVFSKDDEYIGEPDSSPVTLLFKWSKPQSIYGHLSGKWESNLADVLNEGWFNAGGQLMVLVRGASEEQMEYLRGLWREGTQVGDF